MFWMLPADQGYLHVRLLNTSENLEKLLGLIRHRV